MKLNMWVAVAAVCACAAAAQTPKPATAKEPATKTTVKGAATSTEKSAEKNTKAHAAGELPAGIPRVHGITRTAFSLRYEDIRIGKGAEAEPGKLYKVLYTGWLASTGYEFDSTERHRAPMRDTSGKEIMGDDGKPKLGPPEPIVFPQGFGRVIPGFDQGFAGMRIGGKRRLFIPWQLAYGAKGHPGPDPAHPGIPPKADLIFDVELVGVEDLPTMQAHPRLPPVRPGTTTNKPAERAAPAHPAGPESTQKPAETTPQPQKN
jgi:peptidylprolyl isomerase